MEENNLTHNMPILNPRKPTSQSHASISLEPNNKLIKNITQACNSPDTKDYDDKGKGKANNDEENGKVEGQAKVEETTGRERLKRHREEVMGNVNIPENWGQEKMMKDWVKYTTFDALFAPHRLIVTARDALIADVRKARSQRLRV